MAIYVKCSLGLHNWDLKAEFGIFGISYLHKCKSCGWWRIKDTIPYSGTLTEYYHPDFYRMIKNQKTGEKRIVSIEQMRKAISKLYGPSWAGKVEKMSDKQVYATYMRLMNAGKLK